MHIVYPIAELSPEIHNTVDRNEVTDNTYQTRFHLTVG